MQQILGSNSLSDTGNNDRQRNVVSYTQVRTNSCEYPVRQMQVSRPNPPAQKIATSTPYFLQTNVQTNSQVQEPEPVISPIQAAQAPNRSAQHKETETGKQTRKVTFLSNVEMSSNPTSLLEQF